ncbi:MAG TPA: cytochrome c3 family protein [Bryobacteraceae bacterium]|nr:cytochrome c3 family protein [Bryobacteraceae bacterium]
MAQVFRRSANTLARASIILAVLGVTGLIGLLMAYDRSDYNTQVGVAKEQPVMFSHRHHTSGLGIHCVYCHTSVEVSSYAGIPPTHTCMSCHSQIWLTSPMLEPVRESYRTGQSLQWNRVHDLPEFVYFNHSIHINKGIGCTTCHGPIGEMNLTYKHSSLQMQWCLECHRDPARFIRPRENVFDVDYRPPPNQMELGRKLVAEYQVRSLQDCYTCHR